ncbi:MAG: hypothetical protein J6A99_03060 [Clostridia bacterium]|nr:hypothetical protein [Clostridia bacterium]
MGLVRSAKPISINLSFLLVIFEPSTISFADSCCAITASLVSAFSIRYFVNELS